MPKKKNEEVEETPVETVETAAAEEVAVEAQAEEAAPVVEEAVPAEEAAVEAAAAEEAAPTVEEKPKKSTRKAAAPKSDKTAETVAAEEKKPSNKRAEKVGIVSSDKMMKTVVVRVDRLVKHPIYRKYVKKRKKFMAHDDLGAKIGDKVKIVETRPLSARKRWRVVEIIQKAQS
jgi:small subunit ribosomal protein S17